MQLVHDPQLPPPGELRFPSPRAAFTLVELLVVIAILALLLTLITPAAERALDRARTSACQSNLRNMGQALLQYANDHRGELVAVSSFGNRRYWFHELEPYLGGPEDHLSLDRPRWQRCPDKRIQIEDNHFIGYGWNFRYFGYTTRPEHVDWGYRTRLHTVPEPAQTVIIGDSVDAEAATEQSFRHPYIYDAGLWTIARRHNGGQNSLYLDGSVRWFRAENLQAQLPLLYRRLKD